MEEYRANCSSCRQFQASDWREKTHVYAEGEVTLSTGDVVGWVVIESGKKAVSEHLIFTTTTHHVGDGPENDEARVKLAAAAMEWALRHFGTDFRLTVNTGLGASTRDHFHAHGKKAGGPGESLVREVANIPSVVTDMVINGDLSREAAGKLLSQVMQKPR